MVLFADVTRTSDRVSAVKFKHIEIQIKSKVSTIQRALEEALKRGDRRDAALRDIVL